MSIIGKIGRSLVKHSQNYVRNVPTKDSLINIVFFGMFTLAFVAFAFLFIGTAIFSSTLGPGGPIIFFALGAFILTGTIIPLMRCLIPLLFLVVGNYANSRETSANVDHTHPEPTLDYKQSKTTESKASDSSYTAILGNPAYVSINSNPKVPATPQRSGNSSFFLNFLFALATKVGIYETPKEAPTTLENFTSPSLSPYHGESL
ncbi:MAG: hypothetical protein JSS53_03205 [Proteobacteria bacterium]|nr:hypothetical protein [Pseudomonadota bacterium]